MENQLTEYKDDDWSDAMKYDVLIDYLFFKEYSEMSFQDLCTRPAWRFRDIYRYEKELRKKYGLKMSRLHQS